MSMIKYVLLFISASLCMTLFMFVAFQTGVDEGRTNTLSRVSENIDYKQMDLCINDLCFVFGEFKLDKENYLVLFKPNPNVTKEIMDTVCQTQNKQLIIQPIPEDDLAMFVGEE